MVWQLLGFLLRRPLSTGAMALAGDHFLAGGAGRNAATNGMTQHFQNQANDMIFNNIAELLGQDPETFRENEIVQFVEEHWGILGAGLGIASFAGATGNKGIGITVAAVTIAGGVYQAYKAGLLGDFGLSAPQGSASSPENETAPVEQEPTNGEPESLLAPWARRGREVWDNRDELVEEGANTVRREAEAVLQALTSDTPTPGGS